MERCPVSPRLATLVVAACFVAAGMADVGCAADDAIKPPTTVRTSHFVVHSDLSEADLRNIVARMESTLATTQKYWGRPLRGPVECYLVNDLNAWQDRALPHPMARIVIARVGGATVGSRGESAGQRRSVATVFASTVQGVAEHEVVHAYCGQTFGGLGPDWYKEGMAQMLTYRSSLGEGVRCPPHVLHAVRKSGHRTLRSILSRYSGPARSTRVGTIPFIR